MGLIFYSTERLVKIALERAENESLGDITIVIEEDGSVSLHGTQRILGYGYNMDPRMLGYGYNMAPKIIDRRDHTTKECKKKRSVNVIHPPNLS